MEEFNIKLIINKLKQHIFVGGPDCHCIFLGNVEASGVMLMLLRSIKHCWKSQNNFGLYNKWLPVQFQNAKKNKILFV